MSRSTRSVAPAARPAADECVQNGAFESIVPVIAPYRLDLTVAVLRRFSTNVVDVTVGGWYARAFGSVAPSIVAVRQRDAESLVVRVTGAPMPVDAAVALARRMLGVGRDLSEFERGAAAVAWLRPLAEAMRGVKPPRYATLWEACVNAVVFQQVSLHAASAILRRTIEALGAPLQFEGAELRAFPAAGEFHDADDAVLRSAGLSAAKIATLRRVAEALESGRLDETELERHSSPSAAAMLCDIKGIGPWTAAVILLRGLGRLDVFPANDSGVARSIAAFTGSPIDVPKALEVLGNQRGVLYYHLLLARLLAAGEIVA